MVALRRTVTTSSCAICLSVVVAEHGDRAVVGLERVVEGQLVLVQAKLLPALVRLAHLLGKLDELLDDLRRGDRAVLVLDRRRSASISEKRPRLDEVAAEARLDLVAAAASRSSSTARLRRGMSRTSARKRSSSTEMSGCSRPATAKMSTTSSLETASRDDLPDGEVELLVGLAAVARLVFMSAARTVWKKPTSSRMREGLVVRHGQRERLAERRHGVHEAALAVLELEDELLGVADELQLLLGGASWPRTGVKSKP